MVPPLLSVSNGHGEDLIATEIIRYLMDLPVVAYPLVGMGDAYPAEVPRLDPRREFPSGGFGFRHGLRGLSRDLRRGFLRFWLSQLRTLAAQRGRVRLTLAVGDMYCLAVARLAGAPTVLVAAADSVIIRPRAMRLRLWRRARVVFARDGETAAFLASRGVNAVYVGNPMLDCLHPAGTDFALGPDETVITLLPGSRAEAPRNAVLLAEVAARVSRCRPGIRFLLTLAPSIQDEEMMRTLRQGGAVPRDGAVEFAGARLLVTRAFADAIDRASLVVGMAGTAHEQAAGLGKPIVAFPGPGPQFTRKFLNLQRRLLGEAVIAVASPGQASEAVLRLLDSPGERTRLGQVGRERMGKPGATARIATEIRALLSRPGGSAS